MKATATTVSACVGLLSVLAVRFPNDPYFYAVVSSNVMAIISRLALAGLLIHIVYKGKFQTIYGRWLLGSLAVLLIAFGICGLAITPLDYGLFNYLKPMDYIFMFGTGVLFTSISLAYERGTRRLHLPFPQFGRPRHAAQLRLFSPRSI